MVVVLWAASDIGGAPVTGQGMQGAGPPQQVEGPIRGGQTEPGRGTPRALEELQSREPTVGGLDRVEDGPALRRQACPGRERQASV